MTEERQKAELVDFEIVQGSEEAPREVSHWPVFRFVFMGLVALALLFIVLAFGVVFMVPLLLFIIITRIVGSVLSTNPQGR